MRSGLLLPWTKAPYGYILDPERPRDASRVHVDLVKAEVVRQIFAWYTDPATPATLYWVAKTLSDRRIPTPTGGVRWNVAFGARHSAFASSMLVLRIVVVRDRRQHSVGSRPCSRWDLDIVVKQTPAEEWIAIPVPPIVSQETFDMAQQRLDQNKQMARRNNHAHDYLLRGLVSCGQCRLGLYRTPGTALVTPIISAAGARTLCVRPRTNAARHAMHRPMRWTVWSGRICAALLTNPELVTHELARAQAGEWLPQAFKTANAPCAAVFGTTGTPANSPARGLFGGSDWP